MEEYSTEIKDIRKTHIIEDTIDEKEEFEDENELLPQKNEFNQLNELYDECITYLKHECINETDTIDPDYESIDENDADINYYDENSKNKMVYKIENELKSNESINSIPSEPRSERLRKLSQQLPKIIITQSNTSLNIRRRSNDDLKTNHIVKNYVKKAEHKSLPKIDHKSIKVYEFQKNTKHEFQKNTKHKIQKNTKQEFQKNTKHEIESNIPKVAENNVTNETADTKPIENGKWKKKKFENSKPQSPRRPGQSDYPKRLVSKRGIENVAVISNVPFERIRLLNDTFHTLINLRWRWIVSGTVVVHFAIWLVFAVFWYIAAWAHYDFEPDPPQRTCVTGGHDFLTIFLASVEAQTTIGFGDRAIDEECPESIFLFIMQLILGTGLSGVLTCVVYAKLTRPEKMSRDGVGFSKRAVISTRDGDLCLMLRAWDLNYDHIISSQFTAHFVHTHRTKEGEVIRYHAQTLSLQQRQFLLWPVTLLHVIDQDSPLYGYGPELIANSNYEITVSLKGASASMGTFTQSQTSYLPREVVWGHRFPPVVKYDSRKQKYIIDHKKLDAIEPIDTPLCSAEQLINFSKNIPRSTEKLDLPPCPGTPGSFSDRISSFHLERSSSFRHNATKSS